MPDLINNSEAFYANWEPKTLNRFILYVDGLPSFLVKKFKRPTIKTERKAIDYINLQRYYAGKTTWDTITMELYDPIVPSATQAVMEWVRLCHESVTGRDGYMDFYKKDLTLDVLGPPGDKVEEWSLKGAFITDSDFGEGDYSNTGDAFTINLTLSIDYAILQM